MSAVRYMPANRDPSVHQYGEVPDGPYLVNPQCSCGWRMAGFIGRQTAWRFWRQHLGQARVTT
jgi:hypothetical protein